MVFLRSRLFRNACSLGPQSRASLPLLLFLYAGWIQLGFERLYRFGGALKGCRGAGHISQRFCDYTIRFMPPGKFLED